VEKKEKVIGFEPPSAPLEGHEGEAIMLYVSF